MPLSFFVLGVLFLFPSLNLSGQGTVVAVDDFYSTSLNTVITVNPIENDFDPDGSDPFLYSVITFPTNGTIGLNPDFSIDYTPNLDYCGLDQFIYSISDIGGALDTATVTIDVSCSTQQNNPPYAGPDVEICALPIVTNTICISPTDPDGDFVSICAFDVLFECTVEILNDTCMQFAAVPASFGINELQIIVCDDGDPVMSDTMSYFINLDCAAPNVVDDQIVISNNSATLNGTPIALNQNTILFDPLLNDSDDCDYILESTLIANGPFEGIGTLSGGLIEYTVNDGYSGTDQFQYLACNECGECSFATVFINVLPPCIEEYNYCVEENVNTLICLELCEADFTIDNISSSQGTVLNVTNDACFTYEASGSGSEILSLDALDMNGNLFTSSLNISIETNCPNLSAENDTAFITLGIPTTLDILANDVNVSGNLPVIIGAPMNGIVTVNLDGTITYEPNAGFTGLETIVYELCDDSGTCDQATIVMVVLENQEPITVDDSVFTLINTVVQIDVLQNDSDPEGDAISLNSISTPANGTAIIFSDEIIYTPSMGFTGIDFMNYEVCDINGNCSTGYILIIVELMSANFPPSFINETSTFSGFSGDTLIYCYEAVDPEGESISYSIDSDNVQGMFTIDSINYCIEYYITGSENLLEIMDVIACDESQNCDTASISFETLADDLIVDATNDTFAFEGEAPYVIDVLANDIFPDNSTINLIGGISSGNLELIGEQFVYNPFGESNSIDTFSYTICNSIDDCDTAEVIFMVGPLLALSDTVDIYGSDPVTISVLDNDVNQIPISLKSVSNSQLANVSFEMNTGIVTYENFGIENEVLTYEIEDKILGELTASAQIVIINHRSEIDCSNQPNSFSPNGDGTNEVFLFSNVEECYPNSTFTVYNRWGEPVYQTSDDNMTEGWNGEDMESNLAVPSGTYYYTIQSSTELLQSGFLQLIK